MTVLGLADDLDNSADMLATYGPNRDHDTATRLVSNHLRYVAKLLRAGMLEQPKPVPGPIAE